jgi:hypothetical protein
MKSAELRKLGQKAFGPRWQTKLARLMLDGGEVPVCIQREDAEQDFMLLEESGLAHYIVVRVLARIIHAVIRASAYSGALDDESVTDDLGWFRF